MLPGRRERRGEGGGEERRREERRGEERGTPPSHEEKSLVIIEHFIGFAKSAILILDKMYDYDVAHISLASINGW